ncbi:MAG: hypothetical protein ACYDBS_06200, partial [Acidimicrobiales bacterium]
MDGVADMKPDETAPSSRPYTAGCLVGSLLATAAFCWMLTGGTWNFFQTGLNANFYDAQARALLAGHWSMPPRVLSIEGFVEHHKTYMYFGPFPALVRMPILLLTHSLDGRLTELSMLVAFVLALAFTAYLGWQIRSLVAGNRGVSRREAVLAGLVMVVVGVGSNFFFLASDPIVYHEAELWGTCLAIGSLGYLVAFLRRQRPGTLLTAGLLATCSMLTRGSVGAGPVAALGITAGTWILLAAGRRLGGSRIVSWLG